MPEQTQDNAVPGAAIPPPARPPVPDLGFFAGPPAATVGSGGLRRHRAVAVRRSRIRAVRRHRPPRRRHRRRRRRHRPPRRSVRRPPRAATTGSRPVQSGLTTGWKAAARWQPSSCPDGTRARWPVRLAAVRRRPGGTRHACWGCRGWATLVRRGDQEHPGRPVRRALHGQRGEGGVVQRRAGDRIHALRRAGWLASQLRAAATTPFASWTKTEQDGTACYSKPAQAAAGVGATMCMNGFWRRGVIVLGMGLTAPDPATVARATNEAWDAQ